MRDIHSFSRRKLLAMLGALPCIPAFAYAAAGLPQEAFASLSKFATGKTELDADLGAKTLAALEAAVHGTPRHDALLALVSAWYTSTVVVKGQPRVITATDALMYRAVSDASHIPGQCAGATNSWAGRARPAIAALPNSKGASDGR